MKYAFSSLILINFLIFSAFSNPYSENSPLYLGNPSNAVSDQNEENNYLMEKSEYTLSYNNFTLGPNWVAWHLSKDNLGEADRSNKFTADKDLPEGWYAVTQKDYQYSAYGFDRGHICPSADRTSSKEANVETFLMTNMLPQAPDCNRIVWKDLESYERQLALSGNELYIFAGGFGRGGIGNRGYFEEIPITKGTESFYMAEDITDDPFQDYSNYKAINVPEFCWKIILVLAEGDDDMNRISSDTQIIAVCIPNTQGCGETGSWEQYECSVDYIEEITNYDFFNLLDDEIEEIIESR